MGKWRWGSLQAKGGKKGPQESAAVYLETSKKRVSQVSLSDMHREIPSGRPDVASVVEEREHRFKIHNHTNEMHTPGIHSYGRIYGLRAEVMDTPLPSMSADRGARIASIRRSARPALHTSAMAKSGIRGF